MRADFSPRGICLSDFLAASLLFAAGCLNCRSQPLSHAVVTHILARPDLESLCSAWGRRSGFLLLGSLNRRFANRSLTNSNSQFGNLLRIYILRPSASYSIFCIENRTQMVDSKYPGGWGVGSQSRPQVLGAQAHTYNIPEPKTLRIFSSQMIDSKGAFHEEIFGTVALG
jgi:hypothetical protein